MSGRDRDQMDDDGTDSADPEAPDEADQDDSDDPELIDCPHCGKSIGEEAEWCHQCGNYIIDETVSSPRRWPLWVIIAAVMAMLGVLMWVL